MSRVLMPLVSWYLGIKGNNLFFDARHVLLPLTHNKRIKSAVAVAGHGEIYLAILTADAFAAVTIATIRCLLAFPVSLRIAQ